MSSSPVAAPRKLTSHKVNNCNEQLEIEVLDEPGAGGASHCYRIGGFNTATNPSDPYSSSPANTAYILFQNGPIGEAGVNGITQEALLAIVEDRLSSFQNGPYSCEENQWALDHVRKAMDWLHARTDRRLAAGIEGTHQPDPAGLGPAQDYDRGDGVWREACQQEARDEQQQEEMLEELRDNQRIDELS